VLGVYVQMVKYRKKVENWKNEKIPQKMKILKKTLKY